jgi:hypothetical protein
MMLDSRSAISGDNNTFIWGTKSRPPIIIWSPTIVEISLTYFNSLPGQKTANIKYHIANPAD